MPKVKLTAKVVENATTPAPGVQIDLFDASFPAFGLRVGGRRKTWFIIYRYGGKQKRHTIGHFPTLSLSDARTAAGKALEKLDEGIDPATARDAAKESAVAAVETFEDAADDFLTKYAERHHKRPEQTRWFLEHYVVPRWRGRPVAGIRKRDVLDLLDELTEQGKGQAANRVLDVLRKMFNWRLDRMDDEAAYNPCARVKAPVPAVLRDTTLNDSHIRAIWAASDKAGYPWGPLVKVLLLTGQRRSEVAGMRWRDLDLDRKLWSLPASQTKAARAHLVPLSPAVVAILESLPRFVLDPLSKGDEAAEPIPCEFVFTTLGDRPVSGFGKAKQRLDTAATKEQKEGELPLPEWRLHDIRRTVVTGLSALGVPEIVKQRIVNHAPRGVTQRHYDHHAYINEKADALNAWSNYILSATTKFSSENE